MHPQNSLATLCYEFVRVLRPQDYATASKKYCFTAESAETVEKSGLFLSQKSRMSLFFLPIAADDDAALSGSQRPMGVST